MTTLLKNWHFMRLFRAAIAVWIIAEAWRTGEWILLLPGGIFAIQALLDVGCCGTAGCAPANRNAYNHPSGKDEEEITFEEVR